MRAASVEVAAVHHPVTVPLADTVDIEVPPLWQWDDDALPALLGDDLDSWARLVLDDTNLRRWFDTDPDLDECDQFVVDWEHATGQNVDTIARLWNVLERWPDQLESDLVAYCGGQDLRHLWQPQHGASCLTWRRLGVLYDGLPGHSLTKTAQANDLGDEKLAELAKQGRGGHPPFSHTDMLLADIFDAINIVAWILRQAHSDPKKAKQIKPPEPMHRPGLVRGRRSGRRSLTPEARELLAYMAANQGALPPGKWRDVDHPPAGTPAGR